MRDRRQTNLSPLLLCAALLATAISSPAWAATDPEPQETSAVIVHVQEASGGPLSIQAVVKLSSLANPAGYTTSTGPGGIAMFSGIPPGDYTVEVAAAGYQAGRDEVTVLGRFGIANSFVMLRPQGNSTSVSAPQRSGGALLVGKARRELDLAIAALRADKPGEALRHIQYGLKHAPGNPDVRYIAALCALRVKDLAGARQHLDSALSLFPDHFGAQMALGELLLQQGAAAGAIPHLEKGVSLYPNSWRGHWLLAEACLEANHDFVKAKFHATHAVELAKDKAAGAEVTLAIAEALAGERDAARARLERFLQDHPQDSSAPRARKVLATPEFSPAASRTEPPAVIPIRAPSSANLLSDVPPGSRPGRYCFGAGAAFPVLFSAALSASANVISFPA